MVNAIWYMVLCCWLYDFIVKHTLILDVHNADISYYILHNIQSGYIFSWTACMAMGRSLQMHIKQFSRIIILILIPCICNQCLRWPNNIISKIIIIIYMFKWIWRAGDRRKTLYYTYSSYGDISISHIKKT